MGILLDKGIAATNNDSARLFESLFGTTDFEHITYTTPSDYVNQYWNAYKASAWYLGASDQARKSKNGKMFEYIIHSLLYREHIVPFYTQAHVTFVPAINYDTILYKENPDGKHVPICLSLKTSFRERWKQADLEGEALKKVHRLAKVYLLSAENDDVQDVKAKIASGDAVGIDDTVYCFDATFDQFIADLKTNTFRRSIQVDVVTGNIIL